MKCTIITFAAVAAVSHAGVLGGRGPVFEVNVADPSLPNGVGSLNLKGEFSKYLVDNVNAGVKYDYNVNRSQPSSVWLSTSADIDNEFTVSAKADYYIASKAAVVEARLERGDDSVSIDYDTGSNLAGPLKIRKTIDVNGRRVTLKPNLNVSERTGELVINAEIGPDVTTAELTLNQADETASLEVSHRLDDYNIISPKVNLKSGDLSVRLNRALDNGAVLEVVADKNNVDWEFSENAWTVRGNVPLHDTGASAISFKRSISLS